MVLLKVEPYVEEQTMQLDLNLEVFVDFVAWNSSIGEVPRNSAAVAEVSAAAMAATE